MVTILSVAGRLPPWSPGDATSSRLAAALRIGIDLAPRGCATHRRTLADVTNPPSGGDPIGLFRHSAAAEPDERDDEPLCSAKGCRRPATYALRWNNPKLHTPDRRKTWLACDDHRESLAAFLDVRGFLRDVAPL
jgi:hypothetical protein